MKAELLTLLKRELSLAEEAVKVLKFSQEKCQAIGIKEDYTSDELDRFEALTSRFARLCDILLQRLFRLLDEIDLDTQGTLRDRINRAEKKGLIGNAQRFAECRMLRNEIAHEYIPQHILLIFKKVLTMTPFLIETVATVKTYCQQYMPAEVGNNSVESVLSKNT
jgi:hypothetical protein